MILWRKNPDDWEELSCIDNMIIDYYVECFLKFQGDWNFFSCEPIINPSVFLSFFGSFAQVRRECDMQIREAEHRHRAELAAEQERVREAHEMVELIQ